MYVVETDIGINPWQQDLIYTLLFTSLFNYAET